MIALTGGIVVAVALFDVMPEALRILEPRDALAVVGAGFILFFVAERLLVLHHRDEPDQARAHSRVGALGAGALSVHSLIDGLGIGLAFQVSTATGILVFIAVVSHDFADGMNTVSFVLFQSDDRRQALRWLTVDAIAPLVGAVIGSVLSISEHGLAYVLALYAGFFLSMGATDLLPEAHSHPSWKRVEAGDGIARYEPAQADGEHHHHLVCRDCGKVEAFSDSRLERAIDRVAGGLGYSVEEHEVVLVGACADCS